MNTVNSVEFVSEAGSILFPASFAAGWGLVKLDGWFGATGNKMPTRERPQADGAFPVSRVVRTSRVMSLDVECAFGSQGERESHLDELAAFGADGPVTMIVAGPNGRSARTVTIEESPYRNPTGVQSPIVSVDLIARDARRYAISSEVPWVSTPPPSSGRGLVWPAVSPLVWPGGGSSGRITITNGGLAPSAPEFRLRGGFSSALITCVETGSRIGLDRFVPSGSVVTVDTTERRATIDGQSDVSRWLRWREWELVPPGSSRSYQFDVSGPVDSPTLEGRVLSAWP